MTSNIDRWNAFLNHWTAYINANPKQRAGQALFNAMITYDKTNRVAYTIVGTYQDPFHLDAHIPACLKLVQATLFSEPLKCHCGVEFYIPCDDVLETAPVRASYCQKCSDVRCDAFPGACKENE